ncbi:GGDEF domain-containing protein [Kineococcus rubinsiae]|uniref:GGDEF domain-containing protein n=1 Tax=Kineococcus rubinsiae TaxID=2609562 RepID=UPI001431E905|nr:GGDEF domain-containing protein [Kineococcus rubinsiae]NIZ90445.1 GGDEF domain-containing protein [Kineococcus rubinsiae]
MTARHARLPRVPALPVRVAVLLAALLATWCAAQLAAGDPVLASAVVGGAEAVVPLVAGVTMLRARTRAGTPRWMRAVWALMGAACLWWSAGQTVYAAGDAFGLLPETVPGPYDVGFLLYTALSLTAATLYAGRTSRRFLSLRALLDGMLLAGSLFSVVWVAWLAHTTSDRGDSLVALLLPLAYPVGDVVVVSVLALTMLRTGVRRAALLLLLANAVMAVADSTYLVGVAQDVFATGGISDYLWMLAFGLGTLAAMEPVGRAFPVLEATRADAAVALPYLTLLPAAAAGIVRLWSTPDRVALLTLGGLVALALARQFVVLRDNRTLLGVNEAQREQLTRMAHTDLLTGLANRRLFTEQLTAAAATAQRQRTSLTVAFVDLDRFKVVNDTLGHAAGDELLRSVAERLVACVRAGDCASRWGGDEFAFLVTDPGVEAGAVVERLRAAIAAPFSLGGTVVNASASIGAVSEVPLPGRPVEQVVDALLAAADAEMYVVKRAAPAPARAADALALDGVDRT